MTMEKDIGAHIAGRGCQAVSVTAGAGGDGSEVDGQWLDRMGFKSAKLVVLYDATLAEGETLSIAANLQDATAAAGTGAADFGDALANAVVATGDTGGSTEIGVVELDVNLTEANRFVRAQFTPTFSASATDTGIIGAVLVLGGPDRKPAV